MNTLGNTLVGAVVVLSLVALGWVIVPAIKDGRSPSGPGCQASPGATCGVSALRVSIPIASSTKEK